MNITFLIGNGFDRGFGIDTDYASFLDYYLGINPDDSDIYEFKKRIERFRKSQDNRWADCEVAKGEDSQNFTDGTIFLKCWDDFFAELLEYLNTQSDRIDESGYEEYSAEVKRSLLSFDRTLGLKDGDVIRNHPSYYKQGNVYFNFICFNYTECLDKCLENLRGLSMTSWSSTYNYSVQIGEVVHPHGCISKGNYIFGVNDANQVANQALLGNADVEIDLIKHMGNSSCKDYQEDEAIKLIDKSDIIFIFGMSLGKTDQQWWAQIGNWLYADSNHLLVIQQHKNITAQSPLWKQNSFEREAKDDFFSLTDLDENEISDADSRVIITFNPEIFQFEQYKG